jgi:diguanylate cyclase (GGDEF)-like protein/PAS domain S-box-containing protein
MAQSRIMVVEDETIIAMDIEHTLQRLDYTVTAVAGTGEEAIAQAAATEPQLVLMDIKLRGEMDGVTAAERIRSTLRIPVIYLTAYADDLTLQRAKITEPYGYILKPFDDRELHVTIEMALYKHQTEQQLQRVERWLAATLNSIGDAVIAADSEGRVTFMNPVAEALTGWSQEQASGQALDTVFVLIDERTRRVRPTPIAQALREGVTINMSDATLLRSRDGAETPVDDSVAPIRDDAQQITGVVVVFRDVSARKRTEAALRRSEERYALAAKGANDGLWDWDLVNETIYYTPRWKAMLGYDEAEIGATIGEWLERVHPEDGKHVKTAISAHLEGRTPHLEVEHRMLHKDGRYRWMLSRGTAVRDAESRAVRMAGSQTDITVRKQAEAQLQHDALHDALTGLPNRGLFMDRLRHAVQHAQRRPEHLFAVLFLDLDRFKHVNDSLGHTAGDQLLIAFAQRLEACLRTEDTVARIGGDEFTILLDGIENIGDAIRVANRVQQDLLAPFTLNRHEVFSTASIGIVLSSPAYDHPEAILRDADLALYRAKGQGRACFAVFDQGMHAHAVDLMELEIDLRRAIEREEFVVYYQPIVSLPRGVITGCEALVRWRNPRRGLVPPNDFIPLAEETGLIVPIGWWVMEQACRQTRRWQAELALDPPLTISVNTSRKQFTQPDFAARLAQVLQETGLDASQLHIEITESLIMEDTAAASATMAQLRQLGVQVHMDDFGTGYSSLSTLHHLPLDALKIDRSFVSRMHDVNENSAIVSTIVALARHLGMGVIAEGIEVAEQLALVRGLECDLAQGYLFARPLDADELSALIAQRPEW